MRAWCRRVVSSACSGAPMQGRHTCMLRRGHVGRRHRDRLRTADGPRNAPETTTPRACIRWLSCGRTDAHCSPSTCVTSASTPRTRRRTAATMRACVGSCIGAMPLRQGVDDHLGIGVPIIRVLQRHGGRIIAASPGLWTLQPCPARRSRCTCLSTASQVASAGAAGVAGPGFGKPRQTGAPQKSFRKQALVAPAHPQITMSCPCGTAPCGAPSAAGEQACGGGAVHMKKAGLSKDNTAFVGRREGGTGRQKASQKMSCLYCRKMLDTSQVKTQRGAVDGSRL